MIVLQVVLTSTWKAVPRAMQKIRQAFKQFAIIINDVTPQLSFKGNRTHEIHMWIASNNYQGVFVAVDDLQLDKMNPNLFKKDSNFINTDIHEGITPQLCEKLQKMLLNQKT